MTDIDDTLTRDGAIEPVALQALHTLRAAGVPVVAITGRPHGWSLPFAATWPVAAIVAENGAVALMAGPPAVHTEFAQDEATRAHNAQRLQQVAAQVLRAGARCHAGAGQRRPPDRHRHRPQRVPSPGRRCHRAGGGADAAEGMTATVSRSTSTAGSATTTSGRARSGCCSGCSAAGSTDEVDRWIYVGDSTNDQPMFQRFTHSVGVANLLRFASQLQHWPAWITDGERGQGFAEVAQALLRAAGGT
jgi:hydroxymethylpyrimidine pyrophosphatase-like HAD family hydrolase